MERENWKRSIWGTHNEIGKLVLILLKKSLVVTARLYKDELDRVLREKKNYKREHPAAEDWLFSFYVDKINGQIPQNEIDTLRDVVKEWEKSISYWERSVEKESWGVRYFYFTHYHCPGVVEEGVCSGHSVYARKNSPKGTEYKKRGKIVCPDCGTKLPIWKRIMLAIF
ncbi:MAG: hypothetical protein AAB736_02480 [Patescibacteria group bacterium]